jgi:hypothetical protein
MYTLDQSCEYPNVCYGPVNVEPDGMDRLIAWVDEDNEIKRAQWAQAQKAADKLWKSLGKHPWLVHIVPSTDFSSETRRTVIHVGIHPNFRGQLPTLPTQVGEFPVVVARTMLFGGGD